MDQLSGPGYLASKYPGLTADCGEFARRGGTLLAEFSGCFDGGLEGVETRW